MPKKELLYKFFEGQSTYQEEVEIRKWMEKSKENEAAFYQERLLYDSLLLNKGAHKNRIAKTVPIKTVFWNTFMRVAVVFLMLTTAGLLINKYFEGNESSQELHTVIVPPGQRINLILSDNSSIWLNSNTTLKYPSQFSKTQRDVYLDGEGYFDVSSNEKQPFIVNTPQGGVRVTGTTFNVSAYSKYEKFETSLFNGSVGVFLKNREGEQIDIKPAQKTVFKNGKLEVRDIEDYDEFLWRRGLIAFKNKQLDEILSVLEQYFDINIQIEDSSLPNNTYTGKFRQSDGIDYALRVLQKSIQFSYERDNEEQTIVIKTI